MSKAKTSYAEQVNTAEVMISGLKKHTEETSRRAIDDAYIQEFEQLKQKVVGINNEQESLKAQQKQKTDELVKNLEELGKRISECKKIVKLDFPQESWREFGVLNKR